ncbi:hypothetical protein [uncultured Eudoraea sp.]|jgi:hypothetical protein|uniref:hypothetical protein n=1 Tax=uncultured Eudoraea sp. TaxID=1035614 RepID=UPI00260E32F0|nr:hypothetical protein [uncultured Eudoraea sp.]
MEKTKLKGRILMELESLISRSCSKCKMTKNFQSLHKAIVKNHYNATDVSIDYHRHRIAMDIVMNEKDYDPKKINLGLPTLYTNLFFNNLCEFLKSCIDKDNRSLAFYAWLLNSYTKKEEELTLA